MEYDAISDYGSEFTPDEEEILSSLLQQVPAPPAADDALILRDIEDDESPRGAKTTRAHSWRQYITGSKSTQSLQQTSRVAVEVAYDSNTAENVESSQSRTGREGRERSVSIEAPVDRQPSPAQPEEPDLRSPLERFRTKPKKALSVTDLVSPSWCELQYWFTLTKYGKKKRTPAMKQGSAVHKTLEDEVHRTVAVEIGTKEDAWGLRIWNIVQGLRTLRETGMTRELEVWGVLDGLVVNGVIDELSYVCPDRGLEAAELESTNVPSPLPADQKSMTDFLSPNGSRTLTQPNFGASTSFSQPSSRTAPRIYVTDVKTRNLSSIPKAASFRPTLMQLMLYHRLLSAMATNKVDTSNLFSRHELRPHEPFTDGFIAQISQMYYDAPSDPSQASDFEPPSSTPEIDQDTMTLLLAHNSLAQLWDLMMREFQTTFPHGEKSIGNVLKAEYRNASDGHVMGSKTFLMDQEALDKYVGDELRWWRGERPAVGVCLEEAYKCGSCEFAEECGWRKGKIEEAREKMRMVRGRKKSAV